MSRHSPAKSKINIVTNNSVRSFKNLSRSKSKESVEHNDVMNTSSCSSSRKSSEKDESYSLEQAVVTTGRESEASVRHVSSRKLIKENKKSKPDFKRYQYASESDNLTKSAYSKAMGSNREEILNKCKQAIENLTFEIEQ